MVVTGRSRLSTAVVRRSILAPMRPTSPLLVVALLAAAPAGEMARYDLARPSVHVPIGTGLAEVSGLAFDGAGRLYAHADEAAVLVELEPATGARRRAFGLTDGRGGGRSRRVLRDDFEDVAVRGDRVFLVTSGAVIWEARLPESASVSPAVPHQTGFEQLCREVEGVALDGEHLLLLCKHPRPAWAGRVIVGAWRIDQRRLERQPRWVLDETALAQAVGAGTFSGSALARFPASDHWLLLAGPEGGYVEIDAGGRVVGGGRLLRQRHRQPEGVAFAPDGTLHVADEGARQGHLTSYARRK